MFSLSSIEHSLTSYFLLSCIQYEHQTFEALLPNTFRIINSKDVIPRVPLLGWGWQGISLYYGVGRQYQIDKEGGGKEDGYLGYIGKFPIILFNALTFQNIGAHLTPAYKQSFIDAAARFRLTGRN